MATQQAAKPAPAPAQQAQLATPAARLAELRKKAASASPQQLWTAALEMRLSQLAAERHSREAAVEAIVEAKQRELDRLLAQEAPLSPAADLQSPAPLDYAQASPFACASAFSPVSRTS